jgi:spore germination cell wall hydrolase CwlJ-like protein
VIKLFLILLLVSFNISAKSKSPVPEGMSEAECLAINIYFEARNEKSNFYKAAVGFVTMRRMISNEWPDSICEVVYEQRLSRRTKKWVAMYSWTLDGLSDNPKNEKAYQNSLHIAIMVLSETIKDKTKKATHYHNTSVNPYWASSLIKTAHLGNHIFYK